MTPRAKIVAWPVPSRHSSPTRPSSAIQISVSSSRCAGTGTLKADTIASTTVFAVSMAISVPMSASRPARPWPFFGLSSSTMAFEPVTDTMRPSDLSTRRDGARAPGMANCMSAASLTLRVPLAGRSERTGTEERKAHLHRRALTLLTTDIEFAAVQLHEGAGDRQTSPCPRDNAA